MILSAFKALFDFDFSEIEERLGIDCFTRLSQYKAIGKKELMYNKNVSEKVQALSERLEKTANEDEFFDVVTDFYKAYGVGMFGLNKAFRICVLRTENHVEFCPINNMDTVMLDDLVGYEIQKKKLVDNTRKPLFRAEKPTMCCSLATAVQVNPQASRPLSMLIMTRVCE